MQVSEIIDQVKQHGFQDQTAQTIFGWINEAYQQVNSYSLLWPWRRVQPFTITIPANSTDGPLPAGFLSAQAVFGPGPYPQEVDRTNGPDYARLLNRNPTLTSDVPQVYTIWNEWTTPSDQGSIKVFPKSQLGYDLTVWGRKQPYQLNVTFDGSGNLTADDTPPWPLHHHALLIQGALVRAYQRFDDMGNLQDVESRFMRELENMEMDLNAYQQQRIVDTDGNYGDGHLGNGLGWGF